ncbi:TPA: hypothetical protein ACWR5V_005321, partial [Escherichia coli]
RFSGIKKPAQWRGTFDKNDKGTIKMPFTQGQQACHHLIATPGFLFGSLTSPIRAGCKNSSNVRHKTPTVRANLPQIPEKSTLLSGYLF